MSTLKQLKTKLLQKGNYSGETKSGTCMASFYTAEDVDTLISTAKREALGEVDIEAIKWAYKKLVAYGTQNSSTENAMMMDRLNDLSHLEAEITSLTDGK